MILLNLVVSLVIIVRCADSKPDFYLIETKNTIGKGHSDRRAPDYPEEDTDDNSAESETSTEDIILDCKCGKENINVADRIVGGEDAEMLEFPWAVAIVMKGQTIYGDKFHYHVCGAVLISSKWVLTAAHCSHDDKGVDWKIENLSVRLGDHNQDVKNDTKIEIIREIDKFIIDPDYEKSSLDNDIALVKMDREVDLMLYTPVCLPELNKEYTGKAYALGWGWTKPGVINSHAKILQKIKIKIRPFENCKRQYPKVTEWMICAGVLNGKKDTCKGDSGGPLTVRLKEYQRRHVLAGLTSWGNDPCAAPGFYGVFTKVSYYIDWIYQTIRDQTESVKFCQTE